MTSRSIALSHSPIVAGLTLLAACSSTPSPIDGGAPSDVGVDAFVPGPFTLTPFDRVRISSHSEDENFQNATAPVDLGGGPFESVVLHVALDTSCYPFERWSEDPPPAGQNYPASCDAFDRNFEFTLDPPADEGGAPGFELVRAITPFGGPATFDVDITDLANARPGTHQLRTHITTWSDGEGRVSGSHGGWWVTATIDVVHGTAPRRVLAAIPLFDGNLTSDATAVTVPFTLPEGTVSTRLEYRTTGHGGPNTDRDACIGPAEEFCRRQHTLRIDTLDLGSHEPWLNTCRPMCTIAHQESATGGFDYCMQNPTGSVDSVRAPRANWCPGRVTPPRVYDEQLVDVGPGAHEFEASVNAIAVGGSFRTSATIYAFGD